MTRALQFIADVFVGAIVFVACLGGALLLPLWALAAFGAALRDELRRHRARRTAAESTALQ